MGSTSGLRHELHEDSNKGVYTWLNVLLVDALLCFASFDVCLFSIDHISYHDIDKRKIFFL